MTIRAVYENGVFRPTEKVEFPDSCEVEMDVRQVKGDSESRKATMSKGLAKVYEIMGRHHSSGYTDTAERHNEHQPLLMSFSIRLA